MNWILCLTRNNLNLTREAIQSFRQQDIGDVQILVIDNGSTDSTVNFLHTQKDLFTIFHNPGRGVAESWNEGLGWLFSPKWMMGRPYPSAVDYVLVANNDVILRKDTFRHLVADGGMFVTAVGTQDPAKLKPSFSDLPKSVNYSPYLPPDPAKKRPHPDFSCFLIRRETWEKVGPFDENFKVGFVEDQDYHVRLFNAGIVAEALELPFLHYGSMTIKNAEPAEQKRISEQAALNRAYFKSKWKMEGASKEYYEYFKSSPPDKS